MKILKESLETALGCKESSVSIDDMVRKRTMWNIGATADQRENPKVPIDKIFISRYGECFHVVRDCKTIVGTIGHSRRTCIWCCGV